MRILPIRSHFRLALAMALVLFVTGTIARGSFMLYFVQADSGMSFGDWISSFWLGMRFDIRVALLTVALPGVTATLPWIGRFFRPPEMKRVWLAYWMMACTVWALAVILDAGHYSYLTKRLSATLVSLARDVGEATGMVWQSYPVVWIILGLVSWLLACYWGFSYLWKWAVSVDLARYRKRAVFGAETLVVVCAIFLIHGKVSQYPLRWSDMVAINSVFGQQSALNPLHNMFDTWTYREQRVDDAQMRPDADYIRAFVGLPPLKPGEPVSFLRSVPPKPKAIGEPPLNVVLVLMESFAAHKVGALGSPMGATPSFDTLAKDGLLFTRMMTAHPHTARGVFATVTGMPDVSQDSTASRNPEAADQHTIINEFKGYKKYYFIGGSTSWANVRGVLTSNIDGIAIIEQAQLKSKVEDVWGVSDKNLFLEANEMFRAQTQPFFAFIQTSSNHRPYTIPEEDRPFFNPPQHSEKELLDQGFISPEEYRGFAYLDWCVGQFMQKARQEKYFDNTIFVFIGDHGIIGHTGKHLPRSWEALSITQGHTPLLIYSPKHVKAKRIDKWAQQVDVLPTVASLAGIGYRNTTLGRDLLDSKFDDSRVAFEIGFTGLREKGVLVGNHMLVDRKPYSMFDITSPEPNKNLLETPRLSPELQKIMQEWSNFPKAYGNAARFLQTHNKRFRD